MSVHWLCLRLCLCVCLYIRTVIFSFLFCFLFTRIAVDLSHTLSLCCHEAYSWLSRLVSGFLISTNAFLISTGAVAICCCPTASSPLLWLLPCLAYLSLSLSLALAHSRRTRCPLEMPAYFSFRFVAYLSLHCHWPQATSTHTCQQQ